ncbi:hypothetical protein IPF37_00755 [bacterium]|nr:MAG: hypothetical protein IPF37_00755 [bacterium]
MIVTKTLTQKLTFILSIALSLNNTVLLCADEEAVASVSGQAISTPAPGGFPQMTMNFDPEELQKMLMQLLVQHRQNIADRKQAMFELLPKDVQASIMDATDSYGALIEQLSIGTKIIMLCHDVDTLLEQAYEKNLMTKEEITAFVSGLQHLEQAVITGELNKLIKGSVEHDLGMSLEAFANPADVLGLRGSDEPYTYQDIAALEKQLVHVITLSEQMPELQTGCRDAVLLRDILSVIATKDSDALIDCVLEPLRSKFVSALASFNKVIKSLNLLGKEIEAQEAVNSQEAQEKNAITLKRAVMVWKRDLQKFSVNLSSFMKVWDSADLKESSASKHELFKCVAYTYDVCRSFFDLYKAEMYWDKHISLFKPETRHLMHMPEFSGHVEAWTKRLLPLYTFDWGMSGALSLWHFSNARSDFAKGNLLNIVLNNQMEQGNLLQELMGGGDLIDVKNELIQNLFAGFGAVRILTSSNASCLYKQPSKIFQAAGRVLVAYTYYQLIYDKPFYEKDFWPSDYEHIRRNVFNAVRELGDIMTDALEVKIYEHTDPQVIESLERNTWGVVRPELLTFMMRVMLPVVFMKKPFGLKNVADCNQWDVYGSWFMKLREERVGLFTTKLEKKAWCNYNAAAMQKVFEKNNINVDAYFVEQQIMSYVFSSIGKHWGAIVGRQHGGAMVRAASRVADGCAYGMAAVGLISDDALDVFEKSKDEMIAEWNDYIDMLKMFLKTNFAGIREWAVPYLVEHGYLEEDETSLEMRDKAVISFGLTQLAKNGLISYYEAALLVQHFSGDNDINMIVDKAIEAVRRNLAGKVGGVAGSYLMTQIAEYLSWHYGPFTPKVGAEAKHYVTKLWNTVSA